VKLTLTWSSVAMLVSLICVILSTCPGIVLSFVPPQRLSPQTLREQSLTRASAVTATQGYVTTSSIETVFINRDIPELLDLDHSTQATLEAKTPLIFLPGLDGIEGYQSKSIDSLNEVFDVWRMTVSDDDRSSFMDIASVILEKLETFDKPAVIVGESFGGLLAAYIALRAKRSSISKLVMINPATSFDRTSWPLIAPIIASSGIASPIIQLATILSDAAQIQRAGRKIISGITSTQTAIDAYNGLLESSRTFTQNLSPETINWRISKWFDVGSSLMSEKYSKITTPTLILVGKNDRLLPSQAEGRRLRKEMTSSERVDVKEFDVGHTLHGDSFIDIASELKQVAGTKNAMDCAFPTAEDMVDVEKNFGPFLNSMSPIFLTRGSDGELKRGIDSLPTGINGRPVLLVGNHQLYGADCAQIIREFINTKSTLVRGLAHPMVFNDRDSNPLMAPTLKKYGAVEVSPTAIFEVNIM
jgi:pimeloyl-ACP methyl ester carboxylesterase